MDNETIAVVDGKLGELSKRYDGQFGDLKTAIAKLSEPAPPAHLEAPGGPLAGITSFEVWDIPVGQAVVGGAVAVIGTELIDGFMAAQSGMVRGLVKLAGAGVAVKWGPPLLGSTGSKAVALLMAYDAIRSMWAFDVWIRDNVVANVTRATNKGLVQSPGGIRVIREANRVVSDHLGIAGRNG